MIVLGITNNDLAGACLVRGETIVAAVSEERFSRRKDDRVWPARSIAYVLRAGMIDLLVLQEQVLVWRNEDASLPAAVLV